MMKGINTIILSVACVCLTGLFSSCNQKGSDGEKMQKPVAGKDKIYSGTLEIWADAGLEPIVKQQIEVFEFLNDSVKVNVQYVTDLMALDVFSKRKAGVVVLAREVSGAEKEKLKKADTLHIREMSVAYDAVAMIGHKSFNDADLTMERLTQYFDPKGKSEGARMVFDNRNSSTVNYVVNKLGYKDKVSGNVYALNSVDEVIAYVENNKEAIGFIPYSFISDADNDAVKSVLKRIKILSLHTVNDKGEKLVVSANQSDIAEGTYPLIRTVNVLSKFTYRDDLEWLFMNFLYKEKGAKIFLKAGLIPVHAPIREINVNTGAMRSRD